MLKIAAKIVVATLIASMSLITIGVYDEASPGKLEPRDYIVKYSNVYGVDPCLALAISRLETGNWKSDAFKNLNNFGGMQISGQCLKFQTREEGAKEFIENLYYNYIQIGLTSPETIANKYCPDNSEQWQNAVNNIMLEEKGGRE